ncbi:dihydroorotase [bacterium BMS3Abin04]|nr:dihydroorotase [bacterium BMS3Abin04]
MQVLLSGLKILDIEKKEETKADILINNGLIEKIGLLKASDYKSAKFYNLNNNCAVPGLFDMHVHLREPGREDEETVETGSNAAASGGFTGIACMPNTEPAIDSAEVVNYVLQKSKNHLVDVYPIGAVTLGRNGKNLAPIAELIDAGTIAFSDDGVAVKNASILRRALEYIKMYNGVIIEHCEDESLAGGSMNESLTSTQLGLPPIPTVAEDLIVLRDILMTEYVGGRVHIAHISSKKSVELVRQAKVKGLSVTAEVTPHHFTLTDEALKTFDTNYKMNPPLRTKEDVNAIIEGLKDGTIDCIASDHAPHSAEEKDMEFIHAPNGILGLETQLGLAITELVHKNHLSIFDIIEKFSINPRKILNIPIPQIRIGEKANITVFDSDLIWTVEVNKFKSKSKNSPFDKRLLTGKSIAVINNNKMYFEDEYISLV